MIDTSVVEPKYRVSFGTLEDLPEISNKEVVVSESSKSQALIKALSQLEGSSKYPLSLLKYVAKIERIDLEEGSTVEKLEKLLREVFKEANKVLPEGESKSLFLSKAVELLELIK